MKVVVFGAAGPTGLLLTRQALERGHAATAVTRRPGEFPFSDQRLSVVGADATKPEEVSRAIAGAEAVVSVLGAAYSREEITVYSASAQAMIAAMQEHHVQRLVVTSSSASHDWIDPSWSWVERTVARKILNLLGATLYADMRRMEDLVAASGLDWTIMRPLGLANMEPPTQYAVAVDHIPGRQTARRDLASAILDELDPPTNRAMHPRQAVAVATTNKTVSLPATIWREGLRPQLAPLLDRATRQRKEPTR